MKKLNELLDNLINWINKHVSFIKGLAALAFGIALAYIAREVVINLIVFSCGIFLIYFGLTKLKLIKITNIIDQTISKLRR